MIWAAVIVLGAIVMACVTGLVLRGPDDDEWL